MIPFTERANIEIIELERGFVRTKMLYRGNENHNNDFNTASLFTFAEFNNIPLILSVLGINCLQYYLPVVNTLKIKVTAKKIPHNCELFCDFK